MKNPKEALSDAWGIPKDLALDLPHMTLSGNRELYLENYKSLLKYSTEEIIVGGKKFRITISGKKLEIKSIRRDDILILGEITEIQYQ